MRKPLLGALLAGIVFLGGCSGGSNTTSPVGTAPPIVAPPAGDSGCTGSCADATTLLAPTDTRLIIARAVNEAQAQGTPATIAVVDRVGNVLAVYRMAGARPDVTITSSRGVSGGLEGLMVPSELAAIAKAITGAYLSSEGNAFSTRTASQIVQEHFNPGEINAPGGPLFGVQFSQLPCSDLATRFVAGTSPGPHRSPLGLSADPGGFPLYKDGTPIGGIGVVADAAYSLDADIRDRDRNPDEIVAWAGTFGYGAPVARRGDQITIDGKTFRFTDIEFSDLARDPAGAPVYASLGAAVGSLLPVPSYYAGTDILAGTAFGQPASGIRPASTEYAGLDAFVLVDAAGANRYPPRAGTDGANALSADEVRGIVEEALKIANRARAQIRKPLSTQARISVAVTDTNGVALAVARTRDAPVFGTDVALQKARTAMFNSGAYAAGDLASAAAATPLMQAASAGYLANTVNATSVAFKTIDVSALSDYVTRLRAFVGLPTALADGAIAFTDRAGGNLSRPYYPDGISGNPAGPFSHPFEQWSPFQDGLQLDLVYNRVALHLAFYLQQVGLTVSLDGTVLPALGDVPQNCTGIARLPNGIQVFPGSVPIYRGNTLVGGVGVSGDGVDQDDMVSFLGLYNAGIKLGTIANAAPAMRADRLAPGGAHLRYVQCPQAPFIGSTDENVCEGK